MYLGVFIFELFVNLFVFKKKKKKTNKQTKKQKKENINLTKGA